MGVLDELPRMVFHVFVPSSWATMEMCAECGQSQAQHPSPEAYVAWMAERDEDAE